MEIGIAYLIAFCAVAAVGILIVRGTSQLRRAEREAAEADQVARLRFAESLTRFERAVAELTSQPPSLKSEHMEDPQVSRPTTTRRHVSNLQLLTVLAEAEAKFRSMLGVGVSSTRLRDLSSTSHEGCLTFQHEVRLALSRWRESRPAGQGRPAPMMNDAEGVGGLPTEVPSNPGTPHIAVDFDEGYAHFLGSSGAIFVGHRQYTRSVRKGRSPETDAWPERVQRGKQVVLRAAPPAPTRRRYLAVAPERRKRPMRSRARSMSG